MDPTYIRHAPGKSPMGMDLVPVYEDEAPSGSTIKIDPVTIQNMGIKTTAVKQRNPAEGTAHRRYRDLQGTAAVFDQQQNKRLGGEAVRQ